jgi:hypothetical protein
MFTLHPQFWLWFTVMVSLGALGSALAGALVAIALPAPARPTGASLGAAAYEPAGSWHRQEQARRGQVPGRPVTSGEWVPAVPEARSLASGAGRDGRAAAGDDGQAWQAAGPLAGDEGPILRRTAVRGQPAKP